MDVEIHMHDQGITVLEMPQAPSPGDWIQLASEPGEGLRERLKVVSVEWVVAGPGVKRIMVPRARVLPEGDWRSRGDI